MDIQERRGYLGGSDIPHLLSLEPWGCRRRLWYEKTGRAPDFPVDENFHMKRGRRLEDVAAEEYTERTGRKLRRHRGKVHKAKPWRAGHIDRMILDQGAVIDGVACAGPGALELKVPGREGFYAIRRAGFGLHYQVQAQWYCAITGWTWNSIAAFHADSWQLIHRDFMRDDELCAELLEAADKFMAGVLADLESPEVRGEAFAPPRLDQTAGIDRRCVTCPWRKTCQGIGSVLKTDEEEQVPSEDLVSDPGLADLAKEFLETKSQLKEAEGPYKEAEKVHEEVKKELKEKLAGRTAVDAGTGRIFLKIVNIGPRGPYQQQRIRVLPPA